MNGQERYINALKCEPVDRMPVHWHPFNKGGQFQREFDAYTELEDNPEFEACFEINELGDMTLLNWFSRGTTSGMSAGAGGISFPLVYYNVEKDWFYTKGETSKLTSKDKQFKISWFGQVRGTDNRGVGGWYERPFFHGPDALERMEAFYNEFGAPWELPLIDNTKGAKKMLETAEKLGFLHALWGSAPGHFEPMYGGFGPSAFSRLMLKKPAAFKKVCDDFMKHSLRAERLSLEAGHQIIKTGDDLGQKDRTLISPKKYGEFFLPCLKGRCDLAHKHGAVVFMHSCGFQEELVPYYLKAGLDGLQSLEVPAGNDLARIRETVRDKMCLVGGIDTSRILTFGTPAECREHVRSQIKAATTLDGETMDGGYIPGPSHNLIDTPLTNIQAVVKAIGDFCKYPLDF